MLSSTSKLILIISLIGLVACDGIFPNDTWSAGWIKVTDRGDALFYLHFEARNNASTAPLVFWLTGGPGCASELALFYENGPYTINDDLSLTSNPYTWNTDANVIWIDQPVGTGYSNATILDIDEQEIAQNFYHFILGFYELNPQYEGRPLFMTGESYAGHYIPAISAYVASQANPKVNYKGSAIGNGWVDPVSQYPQYANFAYENKLIGNTEYQGLKAGFAVCDAMIKAHLPGVLDLEECNIIMEVILGDPVDPRFNPYDIREKCQVPPLCYNFSLINDWLALETVQAALGTKGKKWEQCSRDVHLALLNDWELDLSQNVSYLIDNNYEVLVYSGDKDFICNWRGGEAWTNNVQWAHQAQFENMNYTVWNEGSNAFGEYKTIDNFTFLRVYNAGHMVPMNQPQAALAIFNKFINLQWNQQTANEEKVHLINE